MSIHNSARTFDLYNRYLFSEPSDFPSHMSQSQINRLLRIRSAFYSWNEFPMRTDNQMIDYIQNFFGVAKSTAYYDIKLVKKLHDTIVNTAREWNQYRLNCMIEEAYAMAKNQGDAYAMAMLIDKFGTYNCLHRPDKDQVPWSEVMPKHIELTDDTSILGIEYDPDIREKAKALIEEYSADIEPNVLPVYLVDDEPGNEFKPIK